jgi:hypothetical protein
MKIDTIDSKNLIITTEIGSKIEIKNNQTVIFDEKEIGLNKIKSIGNADVGITKENYETEILRLTSHKKYSGIISIISLVILIPTVISYRKYVRIGRQLGLGKIDNSAVVFWLVIALITIFYYLYVKGRIIQINKLDFTKIDYPITVECELINGKQKDTQFYIIGYGSMEELKEIKKIILDKRVDSLLI